MGLNVQATRLTEDPWVDIPLLHPLVPLEALDRVKDRQQICVAAIIVDQPGVIERQTREKMALVCNAIIQQGGVKVRCAFWNEHATMLAEKQVNEAVLLYQVLVSKRKTENSWELGSWRGTTIQRCPPELETTLFLGLYILNVSFNRCVFHSSRRSNFCLNCIVIIHDALNKSGRKS